MQVQVPPYVAAPVEKRHGTKAFPIQNTRAHLLIVGISVRDLEAQIPVRNQFDKRTSLEIDLVLLVMNREGAEKMLNNKVSLGVGASVAAGPIGRAANAATDAQTHAEILSYSRARGIFAWIDISGGVLSPDTDANTDAYGADVDPKAIVFGDVPPPLEANPLLKELSRQTAATSGVK